MYDKIQFTLVDCPGHASLIRTIIGGAQIIDIMILVIDAVKGIQTQTAECIVIGEITTEKCVVALNKVDALEEQALKKSEKKIANVLSTTRYGQAPRVAVSAAKKSGIAALIDVLVESVDLPSRKVDGVPFLMSIDHCFALKGKGTVLTGTCLAGKIAVGESFEICEMGQEKKVKSIQIFHQPVPQLQCGERGGLLVSGLDASSLERGLICAPQSVPLAHAVIISIEAVRFHKFSITPQLKFHITLGHSTVMGKLTLFYRGNHASFLLGGDYETKSQMSIDPGQQSSDHPGASSRPVQSTDIPWALLTLETPLPVPTGAAVIGSRLDLPGEGSKICRIAFHGHVLHVNPGPTDLHLYARQEKHATVLRIHDANTVIVQGLLRGKSADVRKWIGMELLAPNGALGKIEGRFGQGDKMRVVFRDGIEGIGPQSVLSVILKRELEVRGLS